MNHWVNIMNFQAFVAQLPRGGRKVLALQLGIAPSYLSRLVAGDRSVTAERALQIEVATLGIVTRQELRPDLKWSGPERDQNREIDQAGANVPSTLNQNIRCTSSTNQSGDTAVNLYSERGAS